MNLRDIVHRAVAEWPPGPEARVWVADGRATALRRQATATTPRTLGGRAGDELTVDIGMAARLAREVASHGADAVALEPQSLRDDVLARLRAQAGVSAARADGRSRLSEKRSGSRMSNVSTRLVRLLNMVPYFQANPRITRAEAAAALGVTEKQLHSDLDQLWLCGLPGYSPGDLIDFEFSGDTIEVTFSAGMDHPLRLTSPEATGILVALRALLDVPGMVDPEAARSAIAKIESAAGEVAGAHDDRSTRRRSRARPPRCAQPCGTVERWRSSTTRRRTTRCPIGSSTRSASCWSPTTPTSRRGAGPRRTSGCSGSTASSMQRCSTSRLGPPEPAVQSGPTRRCSMPTPRCLRRRCSSTARRPGCSTTTRCACCGSCPTARAKRR